MERACRRFRHWSICVHRVVSRTVDIVGSIRGVNAQEHHREAENLIGSPGGAPRPKEHDVALAQVHALLALTATLDETTQVPIDRAPEFPLFDR